MFYHCLMALVIADIEADMITYADYDIVGSVERAQLYIVACRRWLSMRPESASNQSSSMSMSKNFVYEMMQRAEAYVSSNSANRVRFLSAENYRR